MAQRYGEMSEVWGMKTFAAPLDRFTRMITLIVGLVLAGGIISLGLVLLDSHTWDIGIGWMMMASWVLLVVIVAVSFVYRPAGYTVTADALRIERPAGALVLARKDISGAMQIGIRDLGISARVFGSGGFFGYYGLYTSGRFGKVTWYATRRDDFVFVELNNGKKYLLTPDHPAEMVKLLG
jgi:hypothetical protein